MKTVPIVNTAAIDFFQNHLGPWSDDPASIGLTEPRVSGVAEAYIIVPRRGDRIGTPTPAFTVSFGSAPPARLAA